VPLIGLLAGGSLLTQKKAIQHKKPVIHLDMNKVTVEKAMEQLKTFIVGNRIETLNVAGSRGSKDPEVYDKALQVLERCIMKSED
jgi:hypothetical protein